MEEKNAFNIKILVIYESYNIFITLGGNFEICYAISIKITTCCTKFEKDVDGASRMGGRWRGIPEVPKILL